MVFRRGVQDERDRLSLRAALWRLVAAVVSGGRRGQRPPRRPSSRCKLSGRCQTAADRLLDALPAVQLLLHVPALQRGTARPAVRLGAGRELHARPDHSSRSRARLGLGVPHACPRAPVGETVVDRGARDWRNGDLASPPFRSLTVFPQLFQLRIGRRGLDLQFAPSRPVRQLRRDGHLAGRLRRNAARGASADRDFRLPICDRRLSRGAGGLSASVPRAHHHGGHPALV